MVHYFSFSCPWLGAPTDFLFQPLACSLVSLARSNTPPISCYSTQNRS